MATARIKNTMPESLLEWRARQREGAIMKPSTFEEIKAKAQAEGLSAKRAKKVAGKAYWTTARKKYREAKKKKA